MVNMHQFLCGCGFSILKVVGPASEMAGCWTGHLGPQAIGQRITDRAAPHSDSRNTLWCLDIGSALLGL